MNVSYGHYGIQGRICPILDVEHDGFRYTLMITPHKMEIRMLNALTATPLLSWSFDHVKKSWLLPIYSPATPQNMELCEQILVAGHTALDSAEGIEYLAQAKGFIDETQPVSDKPRTPFTMILGVASAHFKADETTATGQDYMARRHSRPVTRTAPRSHVPGSFEPDLSAIP